MNVNPARVITASAAPTLLVHMSATVPPVIREMVLIAKVKYLSFFSSMLSTNLGFYMLFELFNY